MAAVIKYLDPTTQQYIQIPLRPTADVLSVNGKNGIVDLASTDIPMSDGTTTVQVAIDKKLVAPTTAGTAGQFLALDTDGVSTVWKTGGSVSAVSSVNGLTGDVVLNSQNIKMADNTTIEATMSKKMEEPISGSVDQVLTKTSSGYSWANAPVTSVNTKTGAAVLTGADINIDASRTTKLSTAVLGVQVNGTNLTPINNIVNIPLAGSTLLNEKNENVVVPGLVNIKAANGIEIDGDGYLQFNAQSLDAVSGAKNSALATTTSGTAIGDVYMKNSEVYVKTDTGEQKTDLNKEYMNFRTQICAALGISYTTSWDSTNNKVIYTFIMN